MKSGIGKKVLNLLLLVALLAGVGIADWEHFFPLSAHSDLRFQAVGECLEVVVLVVTFAIGYLSFANERRNADFTQVSDGKSALAGAIFAAMSTALNWREFFPNDQFNLLAGLPGLIGSLVIGLLFGVFAFAFHRKPAKPSKEEETSVV